MRRALIGLSIVALCYSCGSWRQAEPYHGHTRETVDGWLLPAHEIGPYQFQIRLESLFSASSPDSQAISGRVESFLLDTAIEQYNAGYRPVIESLYIKHDSGTIAFPLTPYPAPLQRRQNGVLTGPGAYARPIRLPGSVSSVEAYCLVNMTLDTVSRRDTAYSLRNYLHLINDPDSNWVWTTLAQNSPFSPNTTLTYMIPESTGNDSVLVTIDIYNVKGQKVATPVNEFQRPGLHKVTPDVIGLASGVYFYKLTAGTFTQTKKIIVLR